ncbi:hypothetical protein GALMADRAFT_369360 [Galerina marginata CBS 339.88]|uniref:Uncharacterized protein n=1 Tax=Galerina marginata (strain CBS 339.88) TaxID=685588 RepID=A0A067TQS6_GALM3|nr:hypothetical protein GALMADRAFT_369360 [Galerina marginata CBS 339.88]
MKIPTSSSILLATLAMSSSSSCLAAPAGTGAQETGMTSSSSNNHMSSIRDSASYAFPAEMNMQEGSETVAKRTLAYPRDIAQSVVGALGGLITNIQKVLGGLAPAAGAKSMDVDGTSSDKNFDPHQTAALHSAIAEVNRLLDGNPFSGLPVPSAVQGAPGTATSILPLSNDDHSSSSSSATPTGSAVAAADDSTPNAASSASASSAAASASSPAMPVNPPNTPSLPINPTTSNSPA